MAENQFKHGEVAARIRAIDDRKDPWGKTSSSNKFDFECQRKYDAYICGGGEPIYFHKDHIRKKTVTNAVLVHRVVNYRIETIVAYAGMPLLVGDLIVANTLTVYTELLPLGGWVTILAGKSAYIDNSGNIVILTEKSFKEKFITGGAAIKFMKEEKPLTIQPRHGAMSIKG